MRIRMMPNLPEKYKDKSFLTKQQCAEILQVSVRKVEHMIEEGKIEATELGHRTTRIKAKEIEKL